MRPLERFLLGVLVAMLARSEGVGSPAMPIVEPVGDVRELSRFSFRVTTPVVSADEDPDGWSDLRIEGFGTSERRPGAPSLPTRTFLVALPDGATPRLVVEPLGVRLLRGRRPRPVPRQRVTVGVDDAVDDLRARGDDPKLKVERFPDLVADEALYADLPPAVRLGSVGTLRDQRYVEVVVTPARYRADRGGIEVLDAVRITVEFDGAAPSAAAPAQDPRYEDVYRNAFVNYAQGTLFRLAQSEPTPAVAAATLVGPRYEIKVRQTGVLRLDTARLTGSGFLAEPIANWRLRSRGVEVPLHVNDDGDGLLEPGEWVQFWGQALDQEPKTALSVDVPGMLDIWALNDVTDENVYVLTAEPGTHARMVARPSAPTFTRTPPADSEAVARREVDDVWAPLGAADPWSWAPFLTSGGGSTLRTDDVTLPGLASAAAPVTVMVAMKSVTENALLAPDHHSRVTLLTSGNVTLTQQDDDGTFDGRTTYTQSVPWAGGSVTNPLKVRLEARPIVSGNHTMLLDRIEVTYRRTFAAASDGLVFTWPNEDAEFIVSNLASAAAALSVYEVTAPVGAIAQSVRLTGVSVTGAGPFSARFRVDKDLALADGAPRTFAVAGNGAATVPQAADFVADAVSDLRDNANQADLIVIGHPSVTDAGAGTPLAQLLALRASRGISSKVVSLDDVVDEFNDGIAGPAAIKKFLTWVLSTAPAEGWAQPKPAYVLLLGDGSFDVKAGTANGTFVPTEILFKDDPSIGYYASDNALATVIGSDSIPDLSIGRLPARTLTEANTMLQKILSYETAAPVGSWQAHALFVTDKGHGAAETSDFETLNADSQALMKLPPHTARQLRYATDYGGNNPTQIKTDIKKAINGTLDAGIDGAAVMQYIGHGNFDLWSDDIIFDKTDTSALVNGLRLPLLLAHNCLTGGFHTTGATTIGESFLQRSGGGAIAVFSPSGLSIIDQGRTMSEQVWEDLYGPRKERLLAEPTLDAIVTLCTSNADIEACQAYVLLGDPTTQLKIKTVGTPGLPAAVPGNARVDLSWTASSTAGAVYDVFRASSLGGAYTKLNGAPLASPVFADLTALNAKTYYYYVVASDASGFESRWSNFNSDCAVSGPDCVSARPLNPNAPAAPLNLVVTDAESGGKLNLSWTPGSEPDLLRYTVHWGTAPGTYTASAVVGLNTVTSLAGLQNGVRYYVAVTATNTSDLISAFSVEGSGIPTFVRGVKSPGFIQTLHVNRSGSDLVLSWSPVTTDIYGKPETAVTYQVFRGTAAGFDPSLAVPISPGNLAATSFTDVGAATGGAPAYFYLVRAVDSDGNPGGLGLQLPNGIDLLHVDKSLVTPGNVVLSWPAVTTDFDGRPSRIREYRVYARGTPFTRADIRAGTVPLLTTTPSTQVELTPPAGVQSYSVLVVDERGNLSSF